MKPLFTSAESVPENSGLTRRPRIGVVGLGSIAQKAYLPILSQAERWELVGAFSPDWQKTQRICQHYRLSVRYSISSQPLNNGNQRKHLVTRHCCPSA